MKISFIVSAYNRRWLVLRCLRSIFTYATQPFEVIYVDGNSTDGTIEAVAQSFPSVKIVKCDIKGTAPTKNFGARFASGDVLAFVDSDAEITEGFTEVIRREFLNDSHLGVLGCKILSIDDKMTVQDAGGMLSPFWTYVARKRMTSELNRRSVVFSVIGISFVVRREMFLELGGFDDDYIYGGEEPDFCWRAWIAGFKVIYIPIIVYHKGIAYKHGIGKARSQKERRKNLFKGAVKNGLITFFKNAQLDTIIKFGAFQFLYFFAWVTREGFPSSMLFGFLDFLRESNKVIHKRLPVQAKRKVPDKVIKQIVGINMHLWILLTLTAWKRKSEVLSRDTTFIM